jgi:hypothetical protein
MKQTRFVPRLSPVIAAARLRRPALRARRASGPGPRGEGCKKCENNYLANPRLSIGHNSGNRRGAGAAPGNRNALRSGHDTAEARADRRYWRILFHKLDAILTALVAVELAGGDSSVVCRKLDNLMSEACAR